MPRKVVKKVAEEVEVKVVAENVTAPKPAAKKSAPKTVLIFFIYLTAPPVTPST